MAKDNPLKVYCPNRECENYGRMGLDNVIRYGTTGRGSQRYRCKVCRRTFAGPQGALVSQDSVTAKDILDTLALLSAGVRISSMSRAKNLRRQTILDWIQEAAQNAETVEDILVAEYDLSPDEIGTMWSHLERG